MSYCTELYSSYYKNICLLEGSDLQEKFPEIKSLNEYLIQSVSLRKLYEQVIENQQNHAYQDAIFYADKLVSLTDGHPILVYLLGECYFLNSDYKKVHSLFVKYKLLNYNINFQILAARSLHRNKHFDLCLNILEMQLEKNYANARLESQKWLLKALCHEANENKLLAISCYFECLKKDPTCNEAFNRLIDCYLLSNPEKEQLLTMLNFNMEDIWIKKYYMARI